MTTTQLEVLSTATQGYDVKTGFQLRSKRLPLPRDMHMHMSQQQHLSLDSLLLYANQDRWV